MKKGLKMKSLKNQIAEIENEIAEAKLNLSNLEEEILKFSDAIDLLENPPKIPVVSGILAPFDALLKVQEKAKNDEEKQQNLGDFKAALKLSSTSLINEKDRLFDLEKQLAELKIELDWQTNYEPQVDRYVNGFTVFTDKQSKKINQIKNDLTRYTTQAKSLNDYFNSSTNQKRPQLETIYHGGVANQENAKNWLERLENEIIPSLQKELAQAESDSISIEELSNVPQFRKWLTSRVEIDKSLQSFLVDQQKYLDALIEFKEVAKENSECLSFDPKILNFEIPIIGLRDSKIVNLSEWDLG